MKGKFLSVSLSKFIKDPYSHINCFMQAFLAVIIYRVHLYEIEVYVDACHC